MHDDVIGIFDGEVNRVDGFDDVGEKQVRSHFDFFASFSPSLLQSDVDVELVSEKNLTRKNDNLLLRTYYNHTKLFVTCVFLC